MFLEKFLLHFFILSFCILHHVSAYSDGAPESACETMIPEHGFPSAPPPIPYNITLSKDRVHPTSTVDITLSVVNPKSDIDYFKGFLILVRKVNGDKALGKFTDGAITYDTIQCDDSKKQSGATHKSNNLKKSVTVQWRPPTEDEQGDYQVYFTVVRERSIYWTELAPPQGAFTVIKDNEQEDGSEKSSSEEEEEDEDEEEDDEDSSKERRANLTALRR